MTGHADRVPRGRLARQPLRALATGLVLSCAVLAPLPAAAQVSPAPPSALDAPLFYQLLIGEMELRAGRAGSAYEIILDAARRQVDDALYERAVEIALQARAGEQALAAARAWREARPGTVAAWRYQTQILLALDRQDQVNDSVAQWLALLPAGDRPGLIISLPRLLAQRQPQPQLTLAQITRLTAPYRDDPVTRTAVRLALARAHLAAGQDSRALALASEAQRDDPAAPGPALLGLELRAKHPEAEALVRTYLARPDAEPAVRLAHIRQQIQALRYAEARTELQRLSGSRPDLADPWLMLGALELELKHPADAERALQRYLALTQPVNAPVNAPPATGTGTDSAAAPPTPAAPTPAGSLAEDDDDSADSAQTAAGLNQAWLLLAQAAEQQGQLRAAEAWLAKVDSPQRALEVQARRAGLLARQGQVDAARALIRNTPERSSDDARAKLLAEAQLLRELKRWTDAAEVLEQALTQAPKDVELLYELAMVEEKRLRFDRMEALLRQVLEIKPTHPHAHNALGYSLADRNLRLDEARVLIQQALNLAPGDPFITDSLGWLEFRAGRHDEALRLLQQAHNARPDTEIAAHLGEVFWAMGRQDEARQVWRAAQARDAQNEVLRETLTRLKVGL